MAIAKTDGRSMGAQRNIMKPADKTLHRESGLLEYRKYRKTAEPRQAARPIFGFRIVS